MARKSDKDDNHIGTKHVAPIEFRQLERTLKAFYSLGFFKDNGGRVDEKSDGHVDSRYDEEHCRGNQKETKSRNKSEMTFYGNKAINEARFFVCVELTIPQTDHQLDE